MLLAGVSKLVGTHMSSREAAKMGDILATEADLLGMIKEVIFALLYTHSNTTKDNIIDNRLFLSYYMFDIT